MTEKVVAFNKWLFDNKIVPNSSFMWFDYTLDREDVCFYELEDLFNAYDSGKTIEDFKTEQINKINNITKKLLS